MFPHFQNRDSFMIYEKKRWVIYSITNDPRVKGFDKASKKLGITFTPIFVVWENRKINFGFEWKISNERKGAKGIFQFWYLKKKKHAI